MKSELVGTFTVSSEMTVSDRSYECAAWWREIVVPSPELIAALGGESRPAPATPEESR